MKTEEDFSMSRRNYIIISFAFSGQVSTVQVVGHYFFALFLMVLGVREDDILPVTHKKVRVYP